MPFSTYSNHLSPSPDLRSSLTSIHGTAARNTPMFPNMRYQLATPCKLTLVLLTTSPPPDNLTGSMSAYEKTSLSLAFPS